MFKRLSGFWGFVSPTKDTSPAQTKPTPTPQTAPPNPREQAGTPRKGSLDDIMRHSRSMSPIARVDSWRLGSDRSVQVGSKRKGLFGEIDDELERKRGRMGSDDDGSSENEEAEFDEDAMVDSDQEMGDYVDEDEVDDEEEGEEDDDDNDEDDDKVETDGDDEIEAGCESDDDELPDTDSLVDNMSNIRVQQTSPAADYSDDEEDEPEDTTLVVTDEEYAREIARRKIVNIPAEHSSRGVSTSELIAAGWDDTHIALVQKIAMRGFEPLLPRYYHMDFRYLPDGLYVNDDDHEPAFISSLRGEHFHGIKALEKLFSLGGHLRDRIRYPCNTSPEMEFHKQLKAYIKWADRDSNLDPATAIPLLALEMRTSETPIPVVQESARRKMARLHARYATAFRAAPSIETSSPTSPSSTSPSTSTTDPHLTHPIPQIYALMASHTVIALVAYRPDLPGADAHVKVVSYHDFQDKDYDVWNSLALALVVCHVRNVQVAVAEATGLGVKPPGWEARQVVEDPGL